MNDMQGRPGARVARLTVIGAVAATVGLSGCAAGSGTNGRTQYKGDAVWNISAADAAVAAEHDRTQRLASSARPTRN